MSYLQFTYELSNLKNIFQTNSLITDTKQHVLFTCCKLVAILSAILDLSRYDIFEFFWPNQKLYIWCKTITLQNDLAMNVIDAKINLSMYIVVLKLCFMRFKLHNYIQSKLQIKPPF